MGFISCAPKYPVSTFHFKNPALQDSILVFNQDCELVSQLPITFNDYPKFNFSFANRSPSVVLVFNSLYTLIFL